MLLRLPICIDGLNAGLYVVIAVTFWFYPGWFLPYFPHTCTLLLMADV